MLQSAKFAANFAFILGLGVVQLVLVIVFSRNDYRDFDFSFEGRKTPPVFGHSARFGTMHRVHRSGMYSSFQCAGGSQVFPGMALMSTHRDFWPAANHLAARVCVLHDVCVVNGTVTYYSDPQLDSVVPAYASMPAFLEIGLVFAGYRYDLNDKSPGWMPNLVNGRIPTSYSRGPRDTYILDQLSYADNYAHLLIDSLWGGHMAAAMFDFDMTKAQFLGLVSCATNPHFGSDETLKQKCSRNVAKWTSVLSEFPYLPIEDIKTPMCLSALIVGASQAFSLKSFHVMRGIILRNAREYVLAKLNLTENETSPLEHHHVVVLMKSSGGATRAAKYPELCSDVTTWANNIVPSVSIECIEGTPHLTVYSQVKSVLGASVIVTEHGSVSYTTRFARRGASCLHIGEDPPTEMLDAQVFLHDVDRQTFFMSSTGPRRGDLAGMLLLALVRAGERLGLPQRLSTAG